MQEKTIELPVEWIRGMKKHAERVNAAQGSAKDYELCALFGYLSSLEMYLDDE